MQKAVPERLLYRICNVDYLSAVAPVISTATDAVPLGFFILNLKETVLPGFTTSFTVLMAFSIVLPLLLLKVIRTSTSLNEARVALFVISPSTTS